MTNSFCNFKTIYSSLLCAIAGTFIIAAPLSAATIVVPLGNSIQDAIDGAANGDTIQLSAGTYTQQVKVVSKNLNIVGVGADVTIIQAPNSSTRLTQSFNFGANYWCVVMVDNQNPSVSQTVNLSDLTVDGNNQQDYASGFIYGNSDRFFAIGYHNANGSISNVHTTSTRQYVNFNELAGGGIIGAADTGTVALNISDTLVDYYQRIGIDIRGAALTSTITNTVVNRGYVLPSGTTTATPNGVQFSSLAKGSITASTVSNNIATVANAAGSGIILFGAGPNTTASNNTLNNNDYSIVGINCGDVLTINNNEVNFTTTPGINAAEGIVVQDTSGTTTISGNVINNIPEVNMDLSSSTNQIFLLSNNVFNGSQVGLLITGNTTSGPVITMNGDSFVGTTGYYIQEVTSPNDVWPSTATVSFDGLVSGHITESQFNSILTKIYDKHNDSSLGLVLDFIPPGPPAPEAPYNFRGDIQTQVHQSCFVLIAKWHASPSPDVVMYRVYKDSEVIDEILVGFPLVFYTALESKLDGIKFRIVAVTADDVESTSAAITITHQ